MKTPYTILHTIETGGPGGAETVLLELASRLNPERFRSLALLPGGHWLPRRLEERGVPCTISESRTWYDPSLLRTMVRLIRRENVDLIHSHLDDQNFYSSVAGLITRRKAVVTYHGAPGLARQQGLRRRFKTWTVRRSASAVVVVSDYLKELLGQAGFSPSRIHRIYNGVDLARFAPTGERRIRAELHLGDETKLVGMVANIRRSKGYEYFIRAACKIVESVPQARFLAIGEADEALARPLHELVRSLGLESRFLFLGFRPDVASLLGEMNVFVLSSTDEGLSIATIEAMAAARPVVVTRSGGPQEIVEEGETGFLVPPADADALAARVCDILRQPELGIRLGNNARAAVTARFSIEQMVHEYESLYQRCLGIN